MSKNTREQVTDAVRNCVDCGSMVIGSSDVEESVDDIMFIIEALEQENKRLREALEGAANDAEGPQRFYDLNGPQWTTPSGEEYENTSDHLNFANEIAEKLRAALEEGKQ